MRTCNSCYRKVEDSEHIICPDCGTTLPKPDQMSSEDASDYTPPIVETSDVSACRICGKALHQTLLLIRCSNHQCPTTGLFLPVDRHIYNSQQDLLAYLAKEAERKVEFFQDNLDKLRKMMEEEE